MGASRKKTSKKKETTATSSSNNGAVPDQPAKEITKKSSSTKSKSKSKKQKKSIAQAAATSGAVDGIPTGSSPASSIVVKKNSKRPPKHSFEMVPTKWEDWKQIYLVGTEWHNYDEAFKIDWDFEHLESQLAEGGALATDKLAGKHLYLFGSTEPQLVPFTTNTSETTIAHDHEKKSSDPSPPDNSAPAGAVVHIPVIIAIASSLPPPETLGIKSVQMVEETFVPMSDLKMSWAPYIVDRDAVPDRERPNIYFLHCARRRSSLKSMKPDELKKYEYCMPYVPSLDTSFADLEEDTEVHIVTSASGKGLVFNFDWEMDELEPFVDDLVKEHSLSDADKETVKNLITEEVKAKKKQIVEEKEARRKKLEAIPEKQRLAIKEMIKYKFYPQNPQPNISQFKSPFINRYYGTAQKVF